MQSFRPRLILLSLLLSISSSAFATSVTVIAPSSDGDGNYVVSARWSTSAGNIPGSLKYYERFNGGSARFVKGGNSRATYTASNKRNGVYSYYVLYCYFIPADPNNPADCSFSGTVSVTVSRRPPPRVPTLSVPSSDNNGSYTVSWTSSSGATSYNVASTAAAGSQYRTPALRAVLKARSPTASGNTG